MSQHIIFAPKLFIGLSTGLIALLAFAMLAWAGARDDCTRKGDWGLRIDACTEMINSEEFSGAERAVAYFYRGFARDSLGEFAGAIDDYSAALQLDPEMVAAYYNRANAYLELKDYPKAIEDYNQAVRIDPSVAHAYNNRGEAYSRLGDDKQAVSDFTQALRVDPTYADAYRNRGVAYESMGRYDRAVNDWDREIDLGGTKRADWWQQYLAAKGHYSGEINGVNSPEVWAALTACAADPNC